MLCIRFRGVEGKRRAHRDAARRVRAGVRDRSACVERPWAALGCGTQGLEDSVMVVRLTVAAYVVAVVSLVSACNRGPSAEDAAQLALTARIAALEERKSLVEDANAIERLQAAYGYYTDRGLWDEVADLFADDGTIEIALDGVYVGKPRVRDYLYAYGGGRRGLADGKLDEHLQVMPVITVAPDGLTAQARWRAITLQGE